MMISTGNFGNQKMNLGFKLVALLGLVLVLYIGTTTATVPGADRSLFVAESRGRPVNKRSFFDVQCKGVYNKGIFAKLDRVCDDCFNLYQEPQLHALCRSNCFGSTFFKGCLDALLLNEEEGKFDEMIEILGKK